MPSATERKAQIQLQKNCHLQKHQYKQDIGKTNLPKLTSYCMWWWKALESKRSHNVSWQWNCSLHSGWWSDLISIVSELLCSVVPGTFIVINKWLMPEQKRDYFSAEELDLSVDGYRTFTLLLSVLSGKAEVGYNDQKELQILMDLMVKTVFK